MNTEKYPDVEFQWQDGAWYDVSLRLLDSCLHVHYKGFSNDYDEILKSEEFKSGEEVRSKFRLSSQQLQDKDCIQVKVGMRIGASCSSDGRDNKFFDAVVKHIILSRHIIVDGEQWCTCKFWVLWLAGPYAKKKKYVSIENICLLNSESNIEIHPALQSFLNLVEDENLHSGASVHVDRKTDSAKVIHKNLKLGTEAIALSPYSGNTSSKARVIPKDNGKEAPAIAEKIMTVEEKMDSRTHVQRKYHLSRKSTKEGSHSPSLRHKKLNHCSQANSLSLYSGNTSSKKYGNQYHSRRKRSTKEVSDSPSLIHKKLKPGTEAISLTPCSGNTSSRKDGNHKLSNPTSLPIQLDAKPEVTPENNRNEDLCDAEKLMTEYNLQETNIGLERREGNPNLFNSTSLPIQLNDSVLNISLPIEWDHTVAVLANGNRDNGWLEAQEGKQLLSSELQCSDNVAIVENVKNCSGWLESEDKDDVAIVENVKSGSGWLEAQEGKQLFSSEFQCSDSLAIVENVKNCSGWLESEDEDEDEDDVAIVENVKSVSGWLEATKNVKNCSGWLESESEDEGQFSSSKLIVLDNLENDISPDDIVSVLSNVTLGIVKVVILPGLEPKKWTNGLVWFKDHQSLLKAYAFLENDNFLTVSSNGRPWVVLLPDDEDGVYEDIFGSLNTMASRNTELTSKKILFVNKGSRAYENAKARKNKFLELKKHLAFLNNKMEHC